MYRNYNANPLGIQTGDCVIRALSKALEQSWEETMAGVCVEALVMCDMPESNRVWGNYLKGKGYKRKAIDCDCTVSEFADKHKNGTYILALSGHVVACVDGAYYDTWNSGDMFPVYFWYKEEK